MFLQPEPLLSVHQCSPPNQASHLFRAPTDHGKYQEQCEKRRWRTSRPVDTVAKTCAYSLDHSIMKLLER
jgi:hypothetical protein